MTKAATSDSVRFYRPRLMPGVELVSVCYRERRFPEHSHGEYVVGAVVAGAETLTVAGRSHRVDAGSVLWLRPDEAHLYCDRDDAALGFRAPTSADPALFAAVCAAHAALRCDAAGQLEQESALGALVQACAVESHGALDRTWSQSAHLGRIAEARAYIDCNYADGFGLRELAVLSGLSVFHFTRSFKKAVGLSPLAYRNQRRVVEARGRLLDGQPIAQVALDMGYADQSHLTRQFQRIVGASPRRYAQQ